MNLKQIIENHYPGIMALIIVIVISILSMLWLEACYKTADLQYVKTAKYQPWVEYHAPIVADPVIDQDPEITLRW